MRVLIDTNIFLDILLKRETLMSESLDLLDTLKSKRDQIYVNASTLKDIYYFASKAFHDSFLARKYILDIYSQINKVVSLSSDDAIEAIYQEGDFEDNCLIESAKRTMCDLIISRNEKDFINKGVPVFTPKQYLVISQNKQ